MKKIIILICVLLVSAITGIFLIFQNKTLKPKREQVNISNDIAEEKVADNEFEEKEKILEQKQEEVKTEIKSESKQKSNNAFSAGKSNSKTENKQSTTISKELPKETLQEHKTENKNTLESSNNANATPPKNNVTTDLYYSITGGKKEFATEGAATARGTEIQNKELDYVLDYNEQHPETPIQPDIKYFRVYPVIDDDGTGYYLHFFCVSGEGNDEKLKNIY